MDGWTVSGSTSFTDCERGGIPPFAALVLLRRRPFRDAAPAPVPVPAPATTVLLRLRRAARVVADATAVVRRVTAKSESSGSESLLTLLSSSESGMRGGATEMEAALRLWEVAALLLLFVAVADGTTVGRVGGQTDVGVMVAARAIGGAEGT